MGRRCPLLTRRGIEKVTLKILVRLVQIFVQFVGYGGKHGCPEYGWRKVTPR
jgi:hypothetical protein